MVLRENPKDYFIRRQQATLPNRMNLEGEVPTEPIQPIVINQTNDQQLLMFYGFMVFVILIAIIITIIYLDRQKRR